MKTFFSWLTPLLAALLLVGCAETPNGAAYAPAGGGFTVLMPGSVQEKTDESGSHMYIGQVAGKDQAFIISYNELGNKVSKANADKVLDNVRNGIAQKNRLISESRITVDGHPARDLKFSTKDGYVMRDRVIIADTRMYQVLAVTSKAEANAPEVSKFIKSFHLTAS